MSQQQQYFNNIPSSSAASLSYTNNNNNNNSTPSLDINHDNDNTGYGLGYHDQSHGTSYSTSNGMISSSSSITNTTTSGIRNDFNNHNNSSTTSSLVQSLLQQCVSYHEEQERIRHTTHPTNIPPDHYNHVNDTTTLKSLPTTTTNSSPTSTNILPIPIVSLPILNNDTTTITNDVHVQPPHFVSSSYSSSSTTTRNIDSYSSNETKEGIQQQQQYIIDQAKERAKLIITRFPKFHDIIANNYYNNKNNINSHQPTNQIVSSSTSIISTTDITSTSELTAPTPTTTIDYIQQRQIGFEREIQRKQVAIIKNLHYIMKQQQDRIEQLTSHIITHTNNNNNNTSSTTTTTPNTTITTDLSKMEQQAYKEYNDTILQQQQQNYEQSLLNQTNRTSKKRGKDSSSSYHNDDKTTVAIYISIQKLDKDDIVTTTTIPNISDVDTSSSLTLLSQYWNESYLQSLFETYGTIRNIYLHRNKQTGLHKGDGLIVYKLIKLNNSKNEPIYNNNEQNNPTTTTDGQTLINLVCGQMNGAELPCGSILHVEPATRNFAKSDSDPGQQLTTTPILTIKSSTATIRDLSDSGVVGESTATTSEKNCSQVTTDDTDDLDEFFDSL